METRALVVRTVAYGEADVIITLLTESEGKVAAIVRGARKGSRRVAGALEPLHTIAVHYEDKGSELVTLKDATVVRARVAMMGNLEAMEAAGTALRWARHVCPPKTPEPAAWASLDALLEALEKGGRDAQVELAVFGLRLLGDVGWGLELEQCVVCGKRCPLDAPAQFDAVRGGIICRACGGARTVLSAALRRGARDALAGEESATVLEQASELVQLVDTAMAAHTGFER